MTEIYSLRPGKFRLDGGAMYGIIPKPLWEKKSPPDELNRIDLDLRLVLILYKDKKILIDTGIGDYHDEKFVGQFDVRPPAPSLKNVLESQSISLTAITDIVLTHLHFDHAGGLVTGSEEGNQRLFPQAKIHLHREHYNYALQPTPRDQGSFRMQDYGPALEEYRKNDQIRWLDETSDTIFDEGEDFQLKFLTTHGHTPYMIHPYTKDFIYLADIIPTSNHIRVPWVMGYDIAPGVSTADKERVMDFISQKNLTVIFEHDPLYWGGRIKKDEKKGYMPGELFETATNDFHQLNF